MNYGEYLYWSGEDIKELKVEVYFFLFVGFFLFII